MVTSIPTFRLKVSEGIIDVDASADRLYGYCIEANKGPVMKPTFVSSSTEAERIFGESFAPHFYQNPVGLVICRVGFDDYSTAKYEYKMFPAKTKVEDGETVELDEPNPSAADSAKKVVLTVSAVSPGPNDSQVIIKASKIGSGFDLFVKIPKENVDKKYQNISNLRRVAKKINNTFGDWFVATLSDGYKDTLGREWFDVLSFDASIPDSYGKLTGGSNGNMRDKNGDPTNTPVDDATNGLKKEEPAESAAGTTTSPTRTLEIAYQKAFDKIQEVDLIGIATLSDSEAVQAKLVNHIEDVTDPEIHQLRFGIIGYTDYEKKTKADPPVEVDAESIKVQAQRYDNPWIIFIGQGVQFAQNGIVTDIPPHKAVQLYTGIRSALGYADAIFGGEDKKVLRGVIDTLPIVTDGTDITREFREELNEAGVCTFKKEYGEVTFLEGVTTVQDDDVLSYEGMMSIVAYVTKRLIRVCKPYQGQLLTEDLKSTLTTALSQELQDITQTDGTLMALEDFNIPPYDVQVYSAAKTRFDETHKLIRESKIIVQCRIVPVGALRDIDLGVIVI